MNQVYDYLHGSSDLNQSNRDFITSVMKKSECFSDKIK